MAELVAGMTGAGMTGAAPGIWTRFKSARTRERGRRADMRRADGRGDVPCGASRLAGRGRFPDCQSRKTCSSRVNRRARAAMMRA